MGVISWGATAAERAERYGCDDVLPDATVAMWRAVDVDAPPPLAFRWLCQLRAAPYSYDWVDNLGRRSPTELTPGLDDLAVGQRVATIFRLVAFAPGGSLTIRTGACAATYAVRARDAGASRYVVKLVLRVPGPAPVARAGGLAFALGDLVMMRRQLRTLARLAARDAGA